MHEHQLVTSYTVWGPTLNLDRLLTRAPPKGRHSTWRRGEVESSVPAITSGLSMIVGSASSLDAHCRTILRFLDREAPFLAAVRRLTGPRDRSELTTTLHVEYPPPEGVQTQKLSLPAPLLGLAARRGVRWSICVSQEPSQTPR
jgi:hypothetical protein